MATDRVLLPFLVHICGLIVKVEETADVGQFWNGRLMKLQAAWDMRMALI